MGARRWAFGGGWAETRPLFTRSMNCAGCDALIKRKDKLPLINYRRNIYYLVARRELKNKSLSRFAHTQKKRKERKPGHEGEYIKGVF